MFYHFFRIILMGKREKMSSQAAAAAAHPLIMHAIHLFMLGCVMILMDNGEWDERRHRERKRERMEWDFLVYVWNEELPA